MTKLSAQDKFIDLSDYGRPFASIIAHQLKDTRFTPIHVTYLFGISGLTAVYCILTHHFFSAGFFLILKSILDAADGELARVKNTPSYTGRYLDSIFDIILNFMILTAVCFVSQSSFILTILAFICIQMQGTLYNYYYVILRNKSVGGDITSKIFEYKTPSAFDGESQKLVTILFKLYTFFYFVFDRTIHFLDQKAYKGNRFPNWFMTLISVYGLGFQLLIISAMLCLQLENYIIPFFIIYTILLFLFVTIRKVFLR